MRFLTVRAEAFGPFAPNETLDFAPGMNVVYGLNEAGKSSWHAALYAGLCGMRRRQGKPDPADQLFADRHRPWGGSGSWAIATVIELIDGSRIELRHDLVTKTARLTDAIFGRPYDLDIVRDGAPDGAVLLGLDRRAFLATACVRQAELLAIRDSSSHLQQYLQQAVATARADATVAGAKQAIEKYLEDFVGTDRRNAIKPLKVAMDAVERCQADLEQAKRDHETHLDLVARNEDKRSQVGAAQHNLDLVMGRQATAEAARLEERLRQAKDFQARFPSGPPHSSQDEDALARTVSGALAAWNSRPPAPTLFGPTSADLRAQLDTLPPTPHGDLLPDPLVLSVRNRFRDAARALDFHIAAAPHVVDVPDSHGFSEEQLRALAFDLRQERIAVDPAVQARRDRSQEALNMSAAKATSKTPLIAGVVLALLGGISLLASAVAPGLALLLAGGSLVTFWAISGRSIGPSQAAIAESQAAGRAFAEQQARAEQRERVYAEAEERVRAGGLLPDATSLQALADAIATDIARRPDHDAWQQRHHEFQTELDNAAQALRTALRGKDLEPSTNLLEDVERYEEQCRTRGDVAREAERRPTLELQLASREAAELAAEGAANTQQQAREGVVKAAFQCELKGETPEQAVVALQQWEQNRKERLAHLDSQQADWSVFQGLLGGRSVEDLERDASERKALAKKYSRSLSPEELTAVVLEPDAATQIESLRDAREKLDRERAELQGRIDNEANRLRSVPEAEEALEAAKSELKRVQQLRETLQLTEKFLKAAEERVNRDVAPRLAASVAQRLPLVTAGCYRDVTVDPRDLNVRVRTPNGMLQSAHLLSQGTTEQVYFLLRVAIAELLTKPDEVCPLILDDVTVQCDSRRTIAILGTLHTLSEERQVILFTQEDEVLQWADSNLIATGRDKVQRLVVAGTEA